MIRAIAQITLLFDRRLWRGWFFFWLFSRRNIIFTSIVDVILLVFIFGLAFV
jgi:hypothetical protein